MLAAGLAYAGAASADVKMGVAGPITGPNASFGAQLTQGVGQAAEDFNKSGGILGQKIVVEPGDDVSDPKQGVSVANKFVGDGVKFVVGHFNSGVTIPASEVYADNGVLFITPSATNPKVTDRKLWDAFRTCGRDDQQGKLWADLALGKLKDKKIAILHDKTPYGQGLADAAQGLHERRRQEGSALRRRQRRREGLFRRRLQDQGFGRRLSDVGRPAHRRRPDRAPDARPGHEDRDDLRRRHHRRRVRPDRRPRRRRHADVVRPRPAQQPDAKDVVAEFKAKGFDPQGYTLYSYAAMQIIKASAEATKSLDPKKMAAYMHEGKPFHTVIGDIAYDKKGDRTNVDYVWYVWEKGADGKITYKQQM